jgi:tRNA-dihydrouridine synthase A
MAEPDRVAECVSAMRAEVDVPVTVKTRIGIDDHDDYAFLTDFIKTVASAGCTKFIVHARKAILEGLSPKENRSIPPLRYEVVYRLKQDFPDLRIILNGGVRTTPEVQEHLEHVDGVMIGRQAYSEPYWLTELQQFVGLNPSGSSVWQPPERDKILAQMTEYAECSVHGHTRMHHITRHMLGLYAGQPGARAWRRYISEAVAAGQASPDLLLASVTQSQ